ncbi:hypothetical protein JXJ21_02035 [candidate division KSB1 bacterium]|nr:hypothetical protein [candidate division KSB1 bacterium]
MQMVNKVKYSGKLIIGLYPDGRYLRVAYLSKHKDRFRLIDAKSCILAYAIEPAPTQNELLPDTATDSSQDPILIDLTSDMGQLDSENSEATPASSENSDSVQIDSPDYPARNDAIRDGEHVPDMLSEIDLLQNDSLPNPQQRAEPESTTAAANEKSMSSDAIYTEKERADQDNAAILLDALSPYAKKKIQLAICMAEPHIYYSYFDSDWGLTGKKLKLRIIDELSRQKPENQIINPESVFILKIANGKILAIVRETEISMLHLIETISENLGRRLPNISISSVEISLVNLVKANYVFQENDISVIVYAGNDFSRLIFMRGNELDHISPIIGEGTDSFGESISVLANTLRSRLLLEQDDMNLPKINNLILTGEASRSEVAAVLVESFGEDATIERLKLKNLSVEGIDRAQLDALPEVSVALGTAWSAFDDSNEMLYSVDMTPFEIKEGQKVFKLGSIVWLLLIMIPLITFFTTQKIVKQNKQQNMLKIALQQRQIELAALNEIQTRVDEASARLTYFLNTFGVLDSMVCGTQTWSSFLQRTIRQTQKIGSIWLTDVQSPAANSATLK